MGTSKTLRLKVIKTQQYKVNKETARLKTLLALYVTVEIESNKNLC